MPFFAANSPRLHQAFIAAAFNAGIALHAGGAGTRPCSKANPLLRALRNASDIVVTSVGDVAVCIGGCIMMKRNVKVVVLSLFAVLSLGIAYVAVEGQDQPAKSIRPDR